MPEPIDEIKETIAEIKGRIDEISAQQNKSSNKTWLNTLSSLAPLISGVLIAAVGTAATIWYNTRQMDIHHLDSLDKFRPYVTSKNPVERLFGYKAFIRLGEKAFVFELIEAQKDVAGMPTLMPYLKDISSQGTDEISQKAESAGDELMAAAAPIGQKEAPPPRLTTEKITSKEGWAYLGQYVKSSKSWKTRYFEFKSDINPNDLKGEWLKVREHTGSLNIRLDMPTPLGKFLEVIDVLKPGSEVKVQDIEEWYTTGYMWAKVSYNK